MKKDKILQFVSKKGNENSFLFDKTYCDLSSVLFYRRYNVEKTNTIPLGDLKNSIMNIFKRSLLIFLLLLFGLLSLNGQDKEIEIKVYSFEEGLTHRNVFKIAQDQEGFIWIATINGLNKFDGHNVLQYSSNNPEYTIPYDYVSDMVIDKDSLIWMSNPNYITVLDPFKNEVIKIQTDSTSAVFDQPRNFSSLTFDANGKILLNTYLDETGESAIQHLSDNGLLEDVMLCKGTYAKRGVIEKNGFYYLAYKENQVIKTDKAGALIKTFDFPELVKGTPSSAWVDYIQLTQDGTLWVLLNNGQVYFLENGQEQFREHPITSVIFSQGIASAMLVEDNGDIWVGGFDNLWFYEAASGKTINYDQRIKDIVKNNCNYRQIFKDDSGVIWIASDYGAIKLVKSDHAFTKYLDEGSEYCASGFCSTRGITEDEAGNIYFSYYNSIHVLDAQTNSLHPLFPQNDFFNFPFGLVYYKEAIYTGNGKRIDLKTLAVDTLFIEDMIDLGFPMVDHEGEIWIGFRNSIYIYDPELRKTRIYQEPNNLIDISKLDISYLYQSKSDNTIWVCTLEDGLYRLKKDKGVIGHYNTEETSIPKLRHNKVNGVFEDNDKNLWLGTGDGLHRWDLKTDKIKIYDTKSGLANNFINGLLPEGDTSVWVSTDVGLARIDLIRGDAVSLFLKEDGISANEFNRASFYQSKNGRMFFGGMSGINAFFPSADLTDKKRKRNNKILFSGFSKLDGNTDSVINKHSGLSTKKPIELSYKDKFFSFEFALANFKNPGINNYSYKLEGFEKDWSKSSQSNVARYNSVPAGDYTFRVRAACGSDNWSEKELNVKVYVEEAFYKTWWFMGLSFLAALAIVAGILEYRLILSIQREKELKRDVKARTLELEHEKRKSDELLLNILPAEIAEELKQFGKAKAKRYNHVSILFTDFKGFTKIAEHLSPEDLVAEIDFCFKNFDAIIDTHGLEKIKTIGDAYMCVGGLPKPDVNNPIKVIEAALEIRDFMLRYVIERKKENRLFFEIRLGINTGDVVSGIVGTKKFAFDIWGDAVNIASRMEENSEVGKINITGVTYELVKDHFDCTYRGKIVAKNKGEIDMYFVERKVGEL
ncbi:MAG: class 3 adenylate cyclase/ligand-binding sensor domain-containing protein [Saprospiraceae bacterium]|jgi:class 3 adenylate cyclase/ligand-binding sensor domain-containing protein